MLVATIAFSVPAVADTTIRDAALCASLGSSARDALSLGYEAEALELVDEALTFVPSNPDANYLRALLGLSRGESLAVSAARLETALVGGSFFLYRPEDARLLYASILARTRQPAEALRLMQGIPVGSEVLFIETIARLALGDDEGSGEAVLASLKRYPVDPRPLVAWLNARDRPIQKPIEKAVVGAGLAALEKLKEADNSVLLALAPFVDSVEAARLLVREFRAMGGTGASATVLALQYGLILEERAIAEMFSGSYAPTRDSILRLYSLISSDASRAAFATAFLSFSGTVVLDVNRDGVAESQTIYDKGQPGQWILDENQDGVPVMQVDFIAGVPVTVHTSQGSTNLVVRYDPWPFAGELDFAVDGVSRRYALGPAIMSLPLVTLNSISGIAGEPYLVERSSMALPSETSAGMLAYAVHTADSGSTTMEIFEGEPLRSWWTDSDHRAGYTMHGHGVPVSEDLDGDADGRFESRRVWMRAADSSSELEYLESDLDGDGLYEYRETLRPDGSTLQSWDYDANGSVDLTRGTESDGRIIYRYFGVRGQVTEARYLDSQLVEVVENGNPAPLSQDSGTAVIWIGAKPFDFGKEIPIEGRGTRNGVMYTVFRIADILYAQLLD